METQPEFSAKKIELARYFKVPGAHLYTVLHHVPEPVARVMLVGPFASERHFSYHHWVRWARHLAARRIEVLRYDYRGMGESTGAFEEMSFEIWSEDVLLLSDWFASRSPGVPLTLHGIELGAILAAKSFDMGIGEALLLWAPPACANQTLRSGLLRWARLEQLFEFSENRTSAAEYIQKLEQGCSIEVFGYQWSSRLWHESFRFCLPCNMQNSKTYSETNKRPIEVVRFGKAADSLLMPYSRYDEVRELRSLYSSSFDWVVGALGLSAGGRNE